MKSVLNLHIEATPDGNLLKWVGTTKSKSAYVIRRSTNEIDFEDLHTQNLSASESETFDFLDKKTPKVTTYYQVAYYEGEKVKFESPVVYVEGEKGGNIRNTILRIVAFVILLALVGMMGKNLRSQAPVQSQLPPAKNIPTAQVIPVKYSNHNAKIEALGQVISAQPIDIVSEVAGKIIKGDVVLRKANTFSSGDLLFRIENQEAILNLKSQRASYQNVIATMLPDIKLDFADQFDKWNNYLQSVNIDRSLPALPNITEQREKVFVATRNIISNYYSIKSQEERMKKYTVTAPYSGMISEVYTDAGSVANPGTRIVKIRRTNQLELELPIRKEDIQFVRSGASVKVFNEDRTKSTRGRVTRISNTVDPQTQSIPVYISLSSTKSLRLFEGLYLYAELSGRSIPNAMEINRKAVLDGNKIFVMDTDSILTEKTITVHKVNTETILFSGLERGNLIVNSNLLGMTEGTKIKPLN